MCVLQILPNHWFFSKSEEEKTTNPRPRRQRTLSEGVATHEEESSEGDRKMSLSRLIARHFTASTDVLEANLSAPQSQ